MSTKRNRWILLAAVVAAVPIAYFMSSRFFPSASEHPFSGPASNVTPSFVDRTADFGLTIAHRQGDERLTGLDETLGSGACALDYDNDGLIDLFIVNGSGDTRYYGRQHWWENARGNRLLRNQDGRHFIDVTDTAGIRAVTHGIGCIAADFDNDGDTDLFITNIGSNLLLRNNGDGTFTDVTKGSGLEGDGWHTAAAVADVDGDGKLDLYVGGFIAFEKGSHTYETNSQFKQDISPFFNSALYPALPNHLFRNLGGLHFQDVTDVAGLADSDGRTLAALWTDINDDGRPDLIVVNATGTGSTTGYLNRGNWHFEPLGIQARIESGLSFRGIALGDLNNDGKAELVLTGASGNQTVLLFRDTATPGADPSFVDEARQWQLAKEQYAAFSPWSPVLADFNNDGWTDLFIANGQIFPDSDSPHVTVGQPKQLWLNGGDSQFHEYRPPPLSPLLDRQSARGMVVADFNNDGALDVYVAHNNDLGQLLINELHSPDHWLGVRLIDTRGNADGVGARVSVTTGQGTQVHWLAKGMGFLSDSDPRLHFGLGSASQAQIEVQWADGTKVVHRNVAADGYVTISRKDGLKREPALPQAGATTEPAILAKDTPEIRTEYFLGLTSVEDIAGVDTKLREALQDPSEQVRSTVVAALGEQRSAQGLTLLLRFLEDRSDSVAAHAVDAVCSFEEENAVRYLLRMFAHDSAVVRQHTADCFMRYYQGFQAQQVVIHRKYLAVPYLAALIADPDRNVRIAAARALGTSEKFRGVPPLIDMLKSPDSGLQREAIRALGLARDKYAVPALLSLLASHHVESATYAQLFIALKRLNYDALDAILRDFAGGKARFAGLGPETRLATLLNILESTEGIVFSRDQVQTLANVTYRSGAHKDKATVWYARIVEKSGVGDAASALLPLLDHSDPQVRSATYLARFTLEPTERIALVNSALRDSDASVRQSILRRIASSEAQIPDTLFVAVLQQEETRLDAINALRSVSSYPVVQMLVKWVEDDTLRKDIRIAALKALSRSNYPLTLPDIWYRTADDDLRIAMLACETRRLPAIFVSRTPPAFLQRYLRAKSPAVRQAAFDVLMTREETWAKQLVAAQLQGSENQALRRHVLQHLPALYFRDSGVLVKLATDRRDPLRFEALRRLQESNDTQSIDGLVAIARDITEDEKARVLAAAALPLTYRKEILPTLLGP
ncbi:MAG: FG-GAP-like repeat-containing protein [Gammaproteobacteria bacterium]